MAIEPKTPRKRVSKPKISKKKAGVPGEVETADVAVVTDAGFTEPAESAPKSRKKAAVPVPVFQAPEPDKAPARARKATAKVAKEDISDAAPDESNDSNDQTIARQLLMQLHDKGLVSTRTLLASFFIDIDIERKNFSEEESYNVHK